MKIYKNFLNKESFLNIKDTLLSYDFPWFLNLKVVSEKDSLLNSKLKNYDFQFCHIFYIDQKINSQYYNLIAPLIDKIKPKSLLKIKANLLTKTHKHMEHGYHVDFNDKKITTGIFYLDDSNGYTKFKNGKKIKSSSNTYVEFNSSLEHTGATQTDEKTRLVINFNYFK